MGPWGQAANKRIDVSIDQAYRQQNALEETQSACSQCAAILAFDPEESELRCTYCGATNQIAIPAVSIVEHDLRAGLASSEQGVLTEETLAVDCEACQAVFSFDANQHAGECPFCGHGIVKDSGPHKQIKPTAVLPFAVVERNAKAAVQSWLRHLWFAPSKLHQLITTDGRLHGIYLPYWTFDSDVSARYSGRRGDIYMEPQRVTVMIDGKRRTETRMVQKVRWRSARGQVSRHFNDILILASGALPEWMAKRLGPWDLSGLKPYTPLFLQGFQAQSYGISLEHGFDEAEQAIKQRIASDVRLHIGGDLQQIHSMQIEHSNSTFKHILLPIWLGVYRYRGRTFHVSVNGQSAEVQGERPYSWVKIASATIISILLAVAVITAVAWSQQPVGH